jgi:hypothetical protein
MFRALPRFSRILLASALAFAPSPFAGATAQPSAGPVPVPYPLTNEVRAAEPAQPMGTMSRVPFPCWPPIKCLLKNDARVAGPASLQTAGGEQVEVLAWSWRAPGSPSADSSDPQEGGEVVGGVDSAATAEARSRKRGAGRASVSEITPTKNVDKSSTVMFSRPGGGTAEPGKIEYPNLKAGAGEEVDEPLPAGTLTVRLARGAATKGKHFPEVTLMAKGQAYRLQDVTVTECAATGENTDTCTLSYQGLGR